ncbi:MAG: DNA/RNA nuclease SfsA [Planctomycetota bacterium]|nr:MAG: DNA/RNA nuclease SfsA [Planctomycetota bacterium]
MKYPPLIKGKLIKRYKRFFVDIKLDSGEQVVAHCVNTGSMKTCIKEDAITYISPANNPKRKLKYTLEIIKMGNYNVGVNTILTNKLAEEAIINKTIKELSPYTELKREVKYGTNSRIDFLLHNKNSKCYVEVKNVSMVQDHTAYFPDSITERGLKHLEELIKIVKQGHRAVMLFVCQRGDAKIFKPADFIDIKYAQNLKKAYNAGVEIFVYQSKVTRYENKIIKPLPWELS